jgi:hypothetical protein
MIRLEAAGEAERAIHGDNVERLAQLTQECPAVLSWRGDSGESLLGFAASGKPYREQMLTRLECAEFLLNSRDIANPAIWEGAIRSRQGSVAAPSAEGGSTA